MKTPNLYCIGKTKPLTKTEITTIEKIVDFPLPADYKDFLACFGFGNINELLMINTPDNEFIRKNFGDCLHFWDIEEDRKTDILNAITIATTIDGDIISVIKNQNSPIVLLPRHSQKPVFFSDFYTVVEYYNKRYNFEDKLYFDPDFNNEIKCINLIKTGKSDKQLMDFLHRNFIEKYLPDNVFNAQTQPKYMLQKIGGWVYFDLLSGNSIRVKYQKQFQADAQEIITFIEECSQKSNRLLVEVTFFNTSDFHRKTVPLLNKCEYRPHFIVKGTNDYLGVCFIEGDAVALGKKTNAIVQTVYTQVDYSALLQPNVKFDILEGRNIVGEGVVIDLIEF